MSRSLSSCDFEQVYEAIIEDKGKNFIFLRISRTCVEELNLSCDQEFSAQVSNGHLLTFRSLSSTTVFGRDSYLCTV